MLSTKDIFGGADEFLVSETILAVGSHGAGSYTNAAGTNWTEYEYIEFTWGLITSTQAYTTHTISKEFIANAPTSFSVRHENAASVGILTLTATGATTFDVVISGSGVNLIQIKGYRKRYGTRNTSKTLMVNGGANIAVNQRYEIDIATELGSDYLNRDLVVVAEIYNDGTSGTAGWGETGWVYNGTNYAGVKASVFGPSIIVQSGANQLCQDSGSSGNPFGNVSAITATTCRVKVWKVDEYLPATKSSGDITTIWTGSAGNGVTIDWSGTGYILSQFDAIFITSDIGWDVSSPLMLPSDMIASSSQLLLSAEYSVAAGYNVVQRSSNITDTSLTLATLSGSNITTNVVTGIYGINYN